MDDETKGLRPQDWQQAIYTQDACNAYALINSLARVLPRIREDGGFEVAKHPIVVLYLEQLCHLSGTTLSHPRWDEAYAACEHGAGIDAEVK